MSESVTITIDATVRVEMYPELDSASAADLQRRFPAGAAVGPTFLRLGRAATSAVLDSFVGADVVDARIESPHDYSDIEGRSLPMPVKYNIHSWLAHDGGFVVLRPGCQRRTVPNLVRNIARASGQHVVVVIPDPAAAARYAAGVDDLGFSDHQKYSTLRFDLAPPDLDDAGIILLYDPSAAASAVLDTISASRASCRLAVVSPSPAARRAADAYACSIGPVRYSNERYVPVDLLPVAVPFDSPVYSQRESINLSDTLLAMCKDQRRILALRDVISRMRGHRTLLLSDRFSLGPLLDSRDTICLPPPELDAVCPGQRAEALQQIKQLDPAGRISVFTTYDNAQIIPDHLRFDTAIYLTPAAGKRQIAASLLVRRAANDNIRHRIIDCVDIQVPELLSAARTRHAMHEKRAKATIYDIDKRLLI